MKRLIALLIALILSAAVLCACVPTATPDTPTTDDTDWINPYEKIDLAEYVTLGVYKDFTVSVTKEEITEELLDYFVTSYYVEYFTTEETDRTVVENTDTVDIVYTPYVDGEAIDGAVDMEETVIVGYSQMIDGFEEGLIGRNLDEEFALDLAFPEDYTTSEEYLYLNGKPVRFEIKITGISTTVIPTKEEFATEEGYNSFEEYREELRADLQTYADNEYDAALSDAIVDTVVKNCTKLETPKSVFDRYMDEYEQQYSEMAYYGVDGTWESVFEMYNGMAPADYANAQIQKEMVLLAVTAAENLTVTDAFYQEEIEMLQSFLQSSYADVYSEEDIVEMFGRDYLHYQFGFDYAIDWIKQTVTNDAMPAED